MSLDFADQLDLWVECCQTDNLRIYLTIQQFDRRKILSKKFRFETKFYLLGFELLEGGHMNARFLFLLARRVAAT